MTLAPQSASWRTQVGPDRTWVRSRTVKRSSAREARGVGIFCTCRGEFRGVSLIRRERPGGQTFPDLAGVVYRGTARGIGSACEGGPPSLPSRQRDRSGKKGKSKG